MTTRSRLLWFTLVGLPLLLICLVGLLASLIDQVCQAAYLWLRRDPR